MLVTIVLLLLTIACNKQTTPNLSNQDSPTIKDIKNYQYYDYNDRKIVEKIDVFIESPTNKKCILHIGNKSRQISIIKNQLNNISTEYNITDGHSQFEISIDCD